MRRHGDLRTKEEAKTLTQAEKKELDFLKRWLTEQLSAPGDSYEDMLRYQKMDQFVDETLAQLRNGK